MVGNSLTRNASKTLVGNSVEKTRKKGGLGGGGSNLIRQFFKKIEVIIIYSVRSMY